MSLSVVPRTNARLGDRNIAVVGPSPWNNLSVGEFRRLLKMFLRATAECFARFSHGLDVRLSVCLSVCHTF